MKDSRIVKGLCDSYFVRKAFDAITGDEMLEVYEDMKADGDKHYCGEWLCDIGCTLKDSDEVILDEIDANIG